MASDALIVGGGIGGLAAALALRQAGWAARVLERTSIPRDLGFALLLAPNAIHALRQLGVADAVVAGGFVATTGEMRRADGRLLRRFDVARVRELLPEPTVTVLRTVLHDALLDALGADALQSNSEVVGFSHRDDGGVEVRLVDGRALAASVLVGADGVGSVVRRQLHPREGPPRRSRLFGLRGVAHDVGELLGSSGGTQYFGCGVEGGLARAGGGAVYWYLSMPEKVATAGSMDPRRVAERGTKGFHERFRTIVSATEPDRMRLDELFDREPLDHWGRGAVTLLGDAAHPMLPHAGQGAAQALEDAVALGRRMKASVGRPEPMLRDYERVRARRTATVVRLARRNARLGSLENGLACWARDRAIAWVPERLILEQLVALGRPAVE
jgi:2-polyprenyl-6-methoxyphenol hydroxylase-like FAD-dependent oxidoreductase